MSKDEVKPNEKTTVSFLEQIKISQNFSAEVQTTGTLVSANLRFEKPPKKSFFRVMGDERGKPHMFPVGFLMFEESKEFYVVHPSLHQELYDDITFKGLYVYATRNKLYGVWPVSLPKGDRELNSWPRSAHQIAAEAVSTWSQLHSGDGSYYVKVAAGAESFSEPEWPELSFNEILEMAIKERFIDSLDHKAVKQLRGLE